MINEFGIAKKVAQTIEEAFRAPPDPDQAHRSRPAASAWLTVPLAAWASAPRGRSGQ